MASAVSLFKEGNLYKWRFTLSVDALDAADFVENS
jgi:hypothetical protein